MAQPAFHSLRRLTVDEALRMVDAGILGEDEPVELLDGWLVEMSPQGPIHAARTTRLAYLLRAVYSDAAHVREEKPLECDVHNLPEPDLAVVRGNPDAYASRHPQGTDALLVIELAWSSQDEDRKKAAIYARAGVPIYWLVDLRARKLEVHSHPEGDAFRVLDVIEEGGEVMLPGLDGSWTVRDMLGSPASPTVPSQ